MVAADNPILTKRYRAGQLESLHRGAWAIADTDGSVVANAGDPDQLIFARSSYKSLQACGVLPLGIVDRFGLAQNHVALIASSHNGQPVHVEATQEILAAAGLDAAALQCGADHPRERSSEPELPICHGCSGKHAGFLAGAVALEQDPASYLDRASPVQQHIQAAVQRLCDVDDDQLIVGIDGCSAPTVALALKALALGIARVANPDSLSGDDADSARVITAAAAAHPRMIAGDAPARFDTELLQVSDGRLFSKGGADGVQVIGVVGAGIAFAGKVDDGDERGLLPVAVAALAALGHVTEAEAAAVAKWADPKIHNADGLVVGEQTVEPLPI